MAQRRDKRGLILIAMNNPISSRPEHALFPAPAGSSGHRLFRMVAARTEINRAQYTHGFRRMNLWPETAWDKKAAMAAGPDVWAALSREHSRVLVFGVEVRKALGMPDDTPEAMWCTRDGVRWAWLPHPSGRCHWYNEPNNKLAAELLLEELWERYRWR